ncbi:uncharacterized protein METZ01_LOCUS113303, partial [marine metagenome]
ASFLALQLPPGSYHKTHQMPERRQSRLTDH